MQSERKQIIEALLAVQAEVTDPRKNAHNPHFQSTYADINALLQVARPILNAHGILLVQTPLESVDGKTRLKTELIHTSGESIEGITDTPIYKQDPQGTGTGLTYLRRYAIQAMLGLGAEDDDGNSASMPPGAPQEKKSAQPHQSGTVTLGTLVPFGKYSKTPESMTWAMVFNDDPDYIQWVIGNYDKMDAATRAFLEAESERRAGEGPPIEDEKPPPPSDDDVPF